MLSDVASLFGDAAIAPAADRRLSRRLLDVWARAARGRYPSWEAMQGLHMGADWDWIFVIDVEKSVGFPYFVYLGERLAKLSDVHLSGETDWTMTVLDKATTDMFSAVASEAPHFREEVLTLCDGRRLLFRVVTAPLADDGERITHVIGAVNGRMAMAPLRLVD